MDCYSARIARIYGYDFTQTVKRDFESTQHRAEIIAAINKIDLPFIRMGNSGDPSEDWAHTFKICADISDGLKQLQLSLFEPVVPKWIVIITRHFTTIPDHYLPLLKKYYICINTSISAVDDPDRLLHCLDQYNRIAPYCKSILRVVTFNFNTDTEQGKKYKVIQDNLLKNKGVIDTVFRPSKANPMLKGGLILAEKKRFIGRETLVSKHNKRVFMGKCQNCLEMCGVTVNT